MDTETPTSTALALREQYSVLQSTPDSLRELLEANVGTGGATDFELDRLRVPGSGGTSWEVPTLGGSEPKKAVDGVIVFWREARAFWASQMNEGGSTPPDCSSHDGKVGIGTPGGPCESCTFAQFGTATKDGKAGRGQACKLTRVLFLVRPGQLLPMVVVVPPSSLKAVKKYFLQLASSQVPYYAVVTSFELQKVKSRDNIEYSQIVPKVAQRLEKAEADRFRAYGELAAKTFARVGVDIADVHGPAADE